MLKKVRLPDKIKKVYFHLEAQFPGVHRVLLKLGSFLLSYGVVKKVKGKGNCIKNVGAWLQRVKITVNGDGNHIYLGKGCFLRKVDIVIKGNANKIVLGDRVRFFEGGALVVEGDGCLIEIEEACTFHNVSFAATEQASKIQVGSDCMFSANISVKNGDSHSILDRVTGKRLNYTRDVYIGRHVWVGPSAVILKGVTVGNHAVIAASALVTKDVPNNAIVAGNPARIVREEITWDRKRIYNDDTK